MPDSREDCLAARARDSKIPTTDQLPLTGGPQMLTISLQRRRLVCGCSPGTAEPFHEDSDTSARRAWIVLGLWRRASGARHVVAAVELPSVADDAGGRIHHSLQLVCCEPRRPGQYGITIRDVINVWMTVAAECWPSDQRLPETANLLADEKAGCTLTAETCFSKLRSDDIVAPSLQWLVHVRVMRQSD